MDMYEIIITAVIVLCMLWLYATAMARYFGLPFSLDPVHTAAGEWRKMRGSVAEQQRQIDDLKRELEEMKGKTKG